MHVLAADEAVCIGAAPSSESYLNQNNILTACEITNADALHPGYGFLSESSSFAKAVADAGLIFIGPDFESIAQLGDKAQAKKIAKDAGCPIIEGSNGIIECEHKAKKFAMSIGFPVYIKARLGGGGRGIRLVQDESEFLSAFNQARLEAKAAFGDDGKIKEIVEKPENPPSNQVVTGLYFYDNKVVTLAKKLKPSKRGELEITDLNNLYHELGELNHVEFGADFAWMDSGTFESLHNASGYIRMMQKMNNCRIGCINTLAEKKGFFLEKNKKQFFDL